MNVDLLNGFSATWSSTIWRASWQGGLAILLVLMITRAIRSIPAFAQCWLWRLAFLKLFIASFAFISFELCWLPPQKSSAGGVISTAVDKASIPNRSVIIAKTDGRPSDISTQFSKSNATEPSGIYAVLSVSSWLMLFWIVGVFACVANLARHWILVNRMAGKLDSTDAESVLSVQKQFPALCQILAENCQRIRLARRPKLLISKESYGPFLFGIFNPVIVLPSAVMTTCSADALNIAILHELAHIKRRDLVWNWLPALAGGLFYFHPLVWLAKREWRLTQEIATDELTVSISHLRVAKYAGLLVELIDKCRPIASHPDVAIGVSETYSQLSRRITAMQSFQRLTKRGTIITSAVALAFLVSGILPWRLTARDAVAQSDDVPPRLQTYSKLMSVDEVAAQEVAIQHVKKLGGTIHFEPNNDQRSVIQIYFPKDSNATDADLAHLRQLPNLMDLTLHFPGLSDAGLEQLKEVKSLKSLSFVKCKVTNDGLGHLTGLTGLSSLGLHDVKIDDTGLAHLKDLVNLEMLFLSNTRITNKGLAHLKGMTRLYHLSLDGTRINDAGLEHLSGLANLQDLRLNNTRVSDEGLSHLKGLTKLKTLVLNNTDILGNGLVHLQVLPDFESLWLSASPVTDAGLENVNGLTGLKTLVLRETNITDAGLRHVKDLARLKTLEICGTKVTDDGLAHLENLKSLRTLNLDHNKGITDEGVEKLRSALPDCQIP